MTGRGRSGKACFRLKSESEVMLKGTSPFLPVSALSGRGY